MNNKKTNLKNLQNVLYNDKANSEKGDNAISEQFLIEGNLYTIAEIQDEIEKLEKEVADWKKEIRDKKEILLSKKTYLREDDLKKQFRRFIAQSKFIEDAVYLNEQLLRLVVGSYYDDIHKYKEYSGSEWANSHKQAAYTIKWIVTFKPIQIREEFDNDSFSSSEILDINLIFALICGFSFLDKKTIDLIFSEKEKVENNDDLSLLDKDEGEKKQSFYDKLLYSLRYRHFTGKHLVTIFEALELNTND